MADYCKKCSEELFDLPSDFKELCEQDEVVRVLCEGCGYTIVDHEGKCVREGCKRCLTNKT